MVMGMYILVDRQPVPEPDLIKWGQWMDKSNRHVRNTHLDDIQVSTVFLGLDHRFGPGTPILFETMIFGGRHDQYQERHETWEQAEKGHEKALRLARAGKWKVINGGRANEAS